MTELCPFNVHVPKWHLVYFVAIDGHFGHFFEIWTSQSQHTRGSRIVCGGRLGVANLLNVL